MAWKLADIYVDETKIWYLDTWWWQGKPCPKSNPHFQISRCRSRLEELLFSALLLFLAETEYLRTRLGFNLDQPSVTAAIRFGHGVKGQVDAAMAVLGPNIRHTQPTNMPFRPVDIQKQGSLCSLLLASRS